MLSLPRSRVSRAAGPAHDRSHPRAAVRLASALATEDGGRGRSDLVWRLLVACCCSPWTLGWRGVGVCGRRCGMGGWSACSGWSASWTWSRVGGQWLVGCDRRLTGRAVSWATAGWSWRLDALLAGGLPGAGAPPTRPGGVWSPWGRGALARPGVVRARSGPVVDPVSVIAPAWASRMRDCDGGLRPKPAAARLAFISGHVDELVGAGPRGLLDARARDLRRRVLRGPDRPPTLRGSTMVCAASTNPRPVKAAGPPRRMTEVEGARDASRAAGHVNTKADRIPPSS
jgi:hypothetical protein